MVTLIVLIIGIAVAATIGGVIWAYSEQTRRIGQKLSDAEAIELARQNGGEMSVALLVEKGGLNASEANTKLMALLTSGIVEQKFNWMNMDSRYVLKGSAAKPPAAPLRQAAKAVSDAEVIQLALQAGGRLTPALLCLKANISIDEAKAKLDELYRKDVFAVDVTESGSMAYIVHDRDLLG